MPSTQSTPVFMPQMTTQHGTFAFLAIWPKPPMIANPFIVFLITLHIMRRLKQILRRLLGTNATNRAIRANAVWDGWMLMCVRMRNRSLFCAAVITTRLKAICFHISAGNSYCSTGCWIPQTFDCMQSDQSRKQDGSVTVALPNHAFHFSMQWIVGRSVRPCDTCLILIV